MLTASEDETARLWDAADGRELATLKGHTAAVERAAFARHGKLILTSSGDNTVRLWPFPWSSPVELIDTGIARVPRCLFEWERRNLFVAEEVPAWCYTLAKPPYRPRRYGFSYETIDAARAKRLGLASGEGLAVERVIRGLSADHAGLKADDVLLQADGAPVADRTAFTDALDRLPAGGSIRLVVLRAGRRLDIELKPAF
jgi:PDZ domain/WD domain, G-beta repeat